MIIKKLLLFALNLITQKQRILFKCLKNNEELLQQLQQQYNKDMNYQSICYDLLKSQIPQLPNDGYEYVIQRRTTNKIVFQCRNSNCSSSLVYNIETKQAKLQAPHNHQPGVFQQINIQNIQDFILTSLQHMLFIHKNQLVNILNQQVRIIPQQLIIEQNQEKITLKDRYYQYLDQIHIKYNDSYQNVPYRIKIKFYQDNISQHVIRQLLKAYKLKLLGKKEKDYYACSVLNCPYKLNIKYDQNFVELEINKIHNHNIVYEDNNIIFKLLTENNLKIKILSQHSNHVKLQLQEQQQQQIIQDIQQDENDIDMFSQIQQTLLNLKKEDF